MSAVAARVAGRSIGSRGGRFFCYTVGQGVRKGWGFDERRLHGLDVLLLSHGYTPYVQCW
jgi:hypothetical protein